MTKTRAHSDIPRGSNAHEDLGALCSLYSFFYPLVINQKAKRAAPYPLRIGRNFCSPRCRCFCLFYFLEVFVNIEEN